MKTLFFPLVFGLFILQSCLCKLDKDEVNPKNDVASCPTVSSSEVPKSVSDSFQKQFSDRTAEKWFRKDDKGYVALISYGDEKTFLHFTNEGKFVKKQHIKHDKKEHHKEKHKHHGEHHKDKDTIKNVEDDKDDQNEFEDGDKDPDHEKIKEGDIAVCMFEPKEENTFEKTWDEGCVCKLIEVPVTSGIIVP